MINLMSNLLFITVMTTDFQNNNILRVNVIVVTYDS